MGADAIKTAWGERGSQVVFEARHMNTASQCYS
jgi:hypothetical protein